MESMRNASPAIIPVQPARAPVITTAKPAILQLKEPWTVPTHPAFAMPSSMMMGPMRNASLVIILAQPAMNPGTA